MSRSLSLEEYQLGIEKRLTIADLQVGTLVKLRALLFDERSPAAEFLAEIRDIASEQIYKVMMTFPERDLDDGTIHFNAHSLALGKDPRTKEVAACGYIVAAYHFEAGLAELTEHLLTPA